MAERLVLANARLIDCVAPEPRAPTPEPRAASVIIERGRIVEILDGGRAPAAAGAAVIDLAGLHLLPGLWDVHVHFEWPRLPEASIAELTLQYAANRSEEHTSELQSRFGT